ncbi:hypothetical protein BC826DRAFT_1082490 [Russula brevipes]|nr:hypothetical protein BC826DRAFT_1082490 [Russula brevipes]
MFLGSPAFPLTTSSVDYTSPTSVRLRLSRMAQLPHDGPDRKEDVCLNAYKSYLTHWHAAPHDELRALSKAPVDNFNGWSLSIIESLDILWLRPL